MRCMQYKEERPKVGGLELLEGRGMKAEAITLGGSGGSNGIEKDSFQEAEKWVMHARGDTTAFAHKHLILWRSYCSELLFLAQAFDPWRH